MNSEKSIRKMDAKELTIKTLEYLNYEYVKSLGDGRIGNVIEVKSPHSKKRIAVKIVIEEDVMENELKVWPKLSHPNIVRLISSNYIDAGRAYIFLMEKCADSLEGRLKNPSFVFDLRAFEMCTKWVKEVFEGISYIHEQNYAHLDLKMNNILIDEDDKALIADFDSITSTEKFTSA